MRNNLHYDDDTVKSQTATKHHAATFSLPQQCDGKDCWKRNSEKTCEMGKIQFNRTEQERIITTIIIVKEFQYSKQVRSSLTSCHHGQIWLGEINWLPIKENRIMRNRKLNLKTHVLHPSLFPGCNFSLKFSVEWGLWSVHTHLWTPLPNPCHAFSVQLPILFQKTALDQPLKEN